MQWKVALQHETGGPVMFHYVDVQKDTARAGVIRRDLERTQKLKVLSIELVSIPK